MKLIFVANYDHNGTDVKLDIDLKNDNLKNCGIFFLKKKNYFKIFRELEAQFFPINRL